MGGRRRRASRYRDRHLRPTVGETAIHEDLTDHGDRRRRLDLACRDGHLVCCGPARRVDADTEQIVRQGDRRTEAHDERTQDAGADKELQRCLHMTIPRNYRKVRPGSGAVCSTGTLSLTPRSHQPELWPSVFDALAARSGLLTRRLRAARTRALREVAPAPCGTGRRSKRAPAARRGHRAPAPLTAAEAGAGHTARSAPRRARGAPLAQ
jgi:hypothetical protein